MLLTNRDRVDNTTGEPDSYLRIGPLEQIENGIAGSNDNALIGETPGDDGVKGEP